MKKNIVIAGASGMIGNLILNLCLSSEEVGKVISLVRKKSGPNHEKLQEVVVKDFSDYSNHSSLFSNIHAAFFCIGVYTGQVSKSALKTITVDYAVDFAKSLSENSPNANLCLLSGAGADRTEKSRTAFAKYKGMAENGIAKLPLNFYTFRPGYIYPVTPRKEPSVVYGLMRRMYPLIRLFGKNSSVKSTELALAVFEVGIHGNPTEILENKDIRALAETLQP